MSIESNPINHSNPLAANATAQSEKKQTTENGATAKVDQKIKEAIPSEIAHPQEQPAGPMPKVGFQAKMLSPASEGTVPNALVDAALLNQESTESSHLPNLNADVMAHTIQSGQAASKLSAEEEMLAGLNFDELSPEEIERMLEEMGKEEAHRDQALETKTSALSAVEKEQTQTVRDESTETQVFQEKAEELQNVTQLAKSIDTELAAVETQQSADLVKIQAETHAATTNVHEALPAESTKGADAAHKAAYEAKMAVIDNQIDSIKSALKADPANQKLQAALDELQAARNDIQMKLDSGMSHEEAMKTTFIGGRSLHDMTLNDLHDTLQGIYHTAHEESHDKEYSDASAKTDERGRADRGSSQDKSAREKADAGKKEEILQARDNQERIVTELQYQQMRSRIEKDKEKLEESLQKILTSVQEDRKMKEIETAETKKDAASDTIVSQGNKQKAIEAAQKVIDEVGTPLKMPVKKETLHMVVSVIRQIDSMPAGKSDPQIRDLQKTLIGFYQDIRQAVGVEVLGGTGNAHRLHTNQ